MFDQRGSESERDESRLVESEVVVKILSLHRIMFDITRLSSSQSFAPEQFFTSSGVSEWEVEVHGFVFESFSKFAFPKIKSELEVEERKRGVRREAFGTRLGAGE
jgi:hypothetical protein